MKGYFSGQSFPDSGGGRFDILVFWVVWVFLDWFLGGFWMVFGWFLKCIWYFQVKFRSIRQYLCCFSISEN